ncbi:MAG: nucleotidyltransferase family protein [Oligoflexia bacterium]|nr:nucleotidyltransferase family protein [Oligoflexia bacterium]
MNAPGDSPTITRAMLMAAGLGTRLRPFTDREPKALLPLLGVPMAQFALDALREAGVRTVVANIHHHPERARAGLQALDRGGVRLEISDESRELLGSAGGIGRALPLLGPEPFYLVNADTLCDIDLAALGRQHQRLRRRWDVLLTLTLFQSGPKGAKYREIRFDPERELVTGLGEPVESRPFFVGAAVLEPKALRNVPGSGPSEFVPTILEPALREGRVGAHLASGSWHDVGSPQLWLQTHLALLAGLETGRISPRWRARVESANRRIGPQSWVSRSARLAGSGLWAGPAYWNPWGDPKAQAPRELGPRAVVYGALENSRLSGGISLGGDLARCEQS